MPNNIEPLDKIWKGKAWSDGVPVTRAPQPDGSIAEGVALLSYYWNGQTWSKFDYSQLLTAPFLLSTAGTVVAAITGRRIKVYAVSLCANGACQVNWRDGTTTQLEGAQSLATNGGYEQVIDPPSFLFATTPGNSLDLVVSGGVAAGRVSYWATDAA
jgi:hypothetical protein